MHIGLISDTHGLVRPQVYGALEGVDLILHAGDVGDGVIDQLSPIAPVRAVLGNTDAPGTPRLAAALDLELAGHRVHVSHGHELGRPAPAAVAARYPDTDIIVYGHTHKAIIEWIGRTLVINPGAAGPRRFDVQPSLARLTLEPGAVPVVELVWL